MGVVTLNILLISHILDDNSIQSHAVQIVERRLKVVLAFYKTFVIICTDHTQEWIDPCSFNLHTVPSKICIKILLHSTMVNNSTHINKTNNHLSLQTIKHRKKPRNMALDPVSDGDTVHQISKCGGLNRVMFLSVYSTG